MQVIAVDRNLLEEFGAEVEFVHSGTVVTGHSSGTMDDGTVIVNIEPGVDMDLKFAWGTHFVALDDIERVWYEDGQP